MKILKIILAIIIPAVMHGQVEFIENSGQWNPRFHHKFQLKYGAVFLQGDGLTAHLFKPSDLDQLLGEEVHHQTERPIDQIHHHAYKQQWLGAQKPTIVQRKKLTRYNNYFKGNDPSKWRGGVPLFQELIYKEVYSGVDVIYTSQDEHLKYNWIITPHANVNQIKWQYNGADSIWIDENRIIISTSVGFVTEEVPAVFTTRNGIRSPVEAQFEVEKGIVQFKIGKYNENDTLIIDPIVVFSSFSGSLSDNWGFTATYDEMGHLFGGGVVFEAGYPVTTGAFQSNHANPTGTQLLAPYGVDCGITKFNPQGTNLIFSTYLGGGSQDQPHSMFTDATGNLYVFGVTGSANFPVTSGAYQTTFAGGDSVYLNGYSFSSGTDIFVVKINPTGTNLLAGTYVGGTRNDGLNMQIVANYADQSRGEIVLDDAGFVYITASTRSSDFPIVGSTDTLNGRQEAIAMKLNNNLTNIEWSTFFGGVEDDAGYGIKVGTNNTVYICGGTEGSAFNKTTNTINPNYQGGTRDGYIASFSQSTGALQKATYIGTPTYDQTFLIDLDKFNNVYVFGQTLGNYPTTSGVYLNANGKQFIHKLNSSLNSTIFSTKFGRGAVNVDLVPTAFNVDDCLNILLSGWGGNTNSGFLGGNVNNMPITIDAVQPTTDGSDFYFMVLGPNATKLTYASYFGGSTSSEHVDGGTSRFDKHGNIYQAVCAGCGGYSDLPTTPGAWSSTNNSSVPSSNCNLGVIKINFETSISAFAEIDSTAAIDTSCNTLTVTFANYSINANYYEWDFGNGKFSNDSTPTVSYDSLGTYTIKLVAMDTICDIADSIEFTLVHDMGTRPNAQFDAEYTSCDVFKTVYITNNTTKANKYFWDFGDGQFSQNFSPTHSYANNGLYTITLIAVDTTCGASDTTFQNIDFTNNIPPPQVKIFQDSCFYGGINVQYFNDSSWYEYEWNFGSVKEKSKYPTYHYPKAGTYNFSLTITDTICNVDYTFQFVMDIERLEDRVFIPNAFTPNRDNKNEEFVVAGNECLTNANFQIFDSWGNVIFETDNPFVEFWDGYINGEPSQEDVYVYYFKSDDFEKRGYITVFY